MKDSTMQTDGIPYSIMLGIAGIWMIGMGLWLTLGINRAWWQWRVLSFQEGYFWAGIPAGLAAISWGVAVLLPLRSTVQGIFFWGGGFLILIAIIFSLGPPWFLKPKWLQELEKRHPHYIKQLRDCARELSKDEWLEIVYQKFAN